MSRYIENLGTIAISLVVVAMVLVVGFLIFAEVGDQAVDIGDVTAVSNESFTFTNATATDLSSSCMDVTCTALYNDTSNAVKIGTGNYTCSISGDYQPQITVTPVSIGVAATLYADYNCKAPTYAYNGTKNTTSAVGQIPSWLPIIIITIIGSLLIALVSRFRR